MCGWNGESKVRGNKENGRQKTGRTNARRARQLSPAAACFEFGISIQEFYFDFNE